MKQPSFYWERRAVFSFLLLLVFVDGSFILSTHESRGHHQPKRSTQSPTSVVVGKRYGFLQRQKIVIPTTIVDSREKKMCLYARSQDNLVAGISEIGFGLSLGVLWSEYYIILSGCGPLNFSDTLEQICYQGVIALSGLSLFNRIVTGKGLDTSVEDFFGPLEDFTIYQVRFAEYASALAAIGAFVALGFQYSRGTSMDGLSGIDISMCRAIRDL
jgi:hypothetical protein